MSASQAATDLCPRCGAGVPARARFCPECGTPLEDPANRTQIVELPREETGPVPINVQRAEPRWFRVAPPTFLLGVSVAVLVLAILLLVPGHGAREWAYGFCGPGDAAPLRAAFMEAAPRRPHEHAAVGGGSRVGERARSS